MRLDVHDGLLAPALLRDLANLADVLLWQFGHKSNTDDPNAFFWFPFGRTEEKLSEFPAVAGLYAALNLYLLKEGYELDDCYANGQTSGLPGAIHIDCDVEGWITGLVYVHPEWRAEWEGETLFYDDAREEIIRAVVPKPGRVVLFDARIPHTARPPGRWCSRMRTSIAFKLRPKGAARIAKPG
jgi:hypothetical protein